MWAGNCFELALELRLRFHAGAGRAGAVEFTRNSLPSGGLREGHSWPQWQRRPRAGPSASLPPKGRGSPPGGGRSPAPLSLLRSQGRIKGLQALIEGGMVSGKEKGEEGDFPRRAGGFLQRRGVSRSGITPFQGDRAGPWIWGNAGSGPEGRRVGPFSPDSDCLTRCWCHVPSQRHPGPRGPQAPQQRVPERLLTHRWPGPSRHRCGPRPQAVFLSSCRVVQWFGLSKPRPSLEN